MSFSVKRLLSSSLFQNFVANGFWQLSNLLPPIILVPYLVNTLGGEQYGAFAFLQTLMEYGFLITDYGFLLSATKRVAQASSPAERAKIFANVVFIKLTLVGILALFFFLGFGLIFSQEYSVGTIGFLLLAILGYSLFPMWYFQGIEKFKFISILNALSKLLLMGTILYLVNERDDLTYAVVAYSIAYLFMGGVGFIYALRSFGTPVFKLLSIKEIKLLLKEGGYFFTSSLMPTIYTHLPVVVLKFFTNNLFVGLFSLSLKIVTIAKYTLLAFVNVLYPRICRKATQLSIQELNAYLKKVYTPLWIACLLGCGLLFGLAPFIVHLVDIEKGSINILVFVLRILSAVPILVATHAWFSLPLMAYGHAKLYSYAILYGSIFALLWQGTCVVLWQRNSLLLLYGISIAVPLTEFIIGGAFYAYYRKLKHLLEQKTT
ncbi:PST family polysaccharide transporter [Thermonema lapsum]|uniref:PST family polysaccharide transporter n=1 Tax=Thermonema lapsum TaxID=28195 RepID=A0A846MTK7_9BACT|nr:oligosaccharide flippase family protein [Thermonema lapsum]NIK74662.1 PST family polysaccharide transporter [Thermonema lapsum]